MQNPLRNLPTVGELLESPPLKSLVSKISRNAVANVVLTTLDGMRHEAVTAATGMSFPSATELAERVARRVAEGALSSPRTTINATGAIFRDDLGGVPLPDAAVIAISASARDYANWELEIVSGKKISRESGCASALRELTGAEAALIVNDGRAAAILVFSALAHGRQIVVSRGEIITFDEEFRLTDAVSASCAKLREVGTTAATSEEDYAEAFVSEEADLGLILRVDPRDYRISGATRRAALGELVVLGRQLRTPVVHLLDADASLDRLPDEPIKNLPNAVESLKAGADVVLLRGDGFVGGPRCGIILGRKAHLETISRHPLARAFSADTLTLTALKAVLQLHRDPNRAGLAVPAVQLLCASQENLRNRAERMAPQIAAAKKLVAAAKPESGIAHLRGESRGGRELPTWRVSVKAAEGSAERLADSLRCGVPSVLCKVEEDRIAIDLRSVMPRQDAEIVSAFDALSAE